MPAIINPYRFGFSLSFVSSVIGPTGATIDLPTVADNDIGILVDCPYRVGASAAPSEVVPTNWTKLFGDSGVVGTTGQRLVVSYRLLTAAMSNSTITGMDSDNNEKVLLVFRPSRAILSVTAADTDYEFTAGNPASDTVTAASGAPPLIVLGISVDGSGNDAPAFSTASPAFDAEVDTTDNLLVGYKIHNSSPSDHTIDMADLGVLNTLATLYVSFT